MNPKDNNNQAQLQKLFETIPQPDSTPLEPKPWNTFKFEYGTVGTAKGNGKTVLFVSSGNESEDRLRLQRAGLGEEILFSYGATPLELFFDGVVSLDIEAQKNLQEAYYEKHKDEIWSDKYVNC